MEYNTTRGPLILPEYGRNVQNMIAHAMELTDRAERNRAAQAIIEVMGATQSTFTRRRRLPSQALDTPFCDVQF